MQLPHLLEKLQSKKQENDDFMTEKATAEGEVNIALWLDSQRIDSMR